MTYPGSLTVTALLFLLSLGLLLHHVRTWQRTRRRQDLSPEDRRYHRRQFFRRVLGSSLMGLLTVGLFVGLNFVSHRQSPLFFVSFWCGMVGLGVWMGLLAMVDLWSVSRYGKRKRGELLNQRREMERELHRFRSHQSNGKQKAVRRADS